MKSPFIGGQRFSLDPSTPVLHHMISRHFFDFGTHELIASSVLFADTVITLITILSAVLLPSQLAPALLGTPVHHASSVETLRKKATRTCCRSSHGGSSRALIASTIIVSPRW